jgi:hypothetical protein
MNYGYKLTVKYSMGDKSYIFSYPELPFKIINKQTLCYASFFYSENKTHSFPYGILCSEINDYIDDFFTKEIRKEKVKSI